MKSKLLVAFVLGIGLMVSCGPVLAHHGNVAYADKIVEFKQAAVTKFAWSKWVAVSTFTAGYICKSDERP